MVFFMGQSLLEISGQSDSPATSAITLWLQVRDVDGEHERLARAGAEISRPPLVEPWGLREMWIKDPDGTAIVLVEVPEGHPLRRDTRSL